MGEPGGGVSIQRGGRGTHDLCKVSLQHSEGCSVLMRCLLGSGWGFRVSDGLVRLNGSLA